MSNRSKFESAALASAILPNIVIAAVADGVQANDTDEAVGISQAVIRDTAGRRYTVYACDDEAGKKRLAGRVHAARTIDQTREIAGLGFATDHVLGFAPGNGKGATGSTAVLVCSYQDGDARPLDLLTYDDCSSVGTVIGAIHRINPTFLANAHYPVYSTEQIHAQLVAWIRRLTSAGHIPQEITSSWARIIDTEGLWSFRTTAVHGGFSDGDLLFSGSSVSAITNWQDMQINDPARDLAWIFARLDERRRNALLAAYGRMLGNRLDDMIMLRANLWLQMEKVGDFIQALNHADNARIMQFKAEVEDLAHQLALTAPHSRPVAMTSTSHPGTLTVDGLLRDGEARAAARANANANATTNAGGASASSAASSRAAYDRDPLSDDTNNTARPQTAATQAIQQQPTQSSNASQETLSVAQAAYITSGSFAQADVVNDFDATGERDITGESMTARNTRANNADVQDLFDMTGERDIRATSADLSDDTRDPLMDADETGERRITADNTNESLHGVHGADDDYATMIIKEQAELFADETGERPVAANRGAVEDVRVQAFVDDANVSVDIEIDEDNTGESRRASDDTRTQLIPQQERERQALRDAAAGLPDLPVARRRRKE